MRKIIGSLNKYLFAAIAILLGLGMTASSEATSLKWYDITTDTPFVADLFTYTIGGTESATISSTISYIGTMTKNGDDGETFQPGQDTTQNVNILFDELADEPNLSLQYSGKAGDFDGNGIATETVGNLSPLVLLNQTVYMTIKDSDSFSLYRLTPGSTVGVDTHLFKETGQLAINLGSPFWNSTAPSHVSAWKPVPEPGTLVLLGGGLIGLAFYGNRRRRK